MKNIFCISLIFILTLFFTPVNAQVQLGLQAGLNFGDISFDPTPEGVSTSARTGVMFGGVLFYSFTPIIGIQFEPAYVQKGAKANESYSEEGMTLEAEETISADYLDLPVVLKASFGDGPVKPFIMAGGTLGFLLGDAKAKIDKATLNGEDVTDMIPPDQREQVLQTKSSEFILNFGAGVIIPAGKVNIFIQGQYNLGLTDINDDPTDDTKVKTTGIQAKAGVLFPL